MTMKKINPIVPSLLAVVTSAFVVAAETGMPGAPMANASQAPLANATPAKADAKGYFYIYADKGSRDNHYIPSGWMGDYGDLRIDDASKDMPKNGTTAFKVTYSAK